MADEEAPCRSCGEMRSRAEFPVQGRRCIHCRRVGVRLHYEANRQYYLDKARLRQRRIIAETRAWLIDYLKAHPCFDCGATDVRVLEFDHRDPATKVLAVAVLVGGGYSLERIQREVTLCDVRCANCHRLRTHAQRGWWGSTT